TYANGTYADETHANQMFALKKYNERKQLEARCSDRQLNMYMQEVRLCSRHERKDAIVPCHHYWFEQEAEHYRLRMLMTKADDRLSAFMDTDTFAERDAMLISSHLIENLRTIHNAGVINNDIKPDNILCVAGRW